MSQFFVGPGPTKPEEGPEQRPMRYGSLAVVSATSLAFGLCLTLLFFGMRAIMELGGFVAVGGPYEVAHPAPDWVWVLPVSIVGGSPGRSRR